MVQHRTLATAAAAAAVFLLVGCSSSATDASASVTTAQQAPGSDHQLTGEITVFAAASLTESFETLARTFMDKHPGVTVRAVYDGSTTLATQLLEGAEADVFASADEATMARVAKAGLMTNGSRVFASNVLAIAVQAGNPLHIENLQGLSSPGRLVVLCAPVTPCGAASAKLLSRAQVHVSPVSEEQNVKAVVTKVALGEADAGLVYATDVKAADNRIDGITIDGADRVAKRYLIGSPASAGNAAAAREFIRLVLSDPGQEILAVDGFGPP
jgi:molybdate transport system substrate-binding protein